MRILITNDDGIASAGLTALAVAARDWLVANRPDELADSEVIVLAPAEEQSGMSAAMGVMAKREPVDYRAVDLPGLTDAEPEQNAAAASVKVSAYSLSSTPAACVILACLGAFGPPVDLVLSGINYGANCGRSVLPSGTLGAALTAANYGISGLAVSQDTPTKDAELRWEVAAKLACDCLNWLLSCPPRTVASLNVPNLERDQIKGLKFAPPLAPLGAVMTQFDRRDEDRIYTRVELNNSAPPDTDRGLVLDGWATLAPMQRPTLDLSVPEPPDVLAGA